MTGALDRCKTERQGLIALCLGIGSGHMYNNSMWKHTVVCNSQNKIHHVMPRERCPALSGLLALISRAYHNFSLWHHELIKAKLSAALVVLN